jgi:N-carbamoylputrescine amidase
VRVTVCQLRTAPGALEDDWAGLVEHVRAERADLVVLPELGFAPWFAAEPPVDDGPWTASVAAHARWLPRLGELGAAVIGTRPVDRPAGRRNEAYAAGAGGPVRPLHDKSYLPDEAGFWEASWYGRGDGGHAVVDVAGARAGVLVCTEMWFLEHARAYGRAGAHLVAVPRCTPVETLDKWLAGGRTCAVVSGAWCLSSNSAEPEHGGLGWVVDPEGAVAATTTCDAPWVTVELDLADAEAAKSRYPRYVAELDPAAGRRERRHP